MFKCNFPWREWIILVVTIAALLLSETECAFEDDTLTLTTKLRHNQGIVAKFGDANHRGERFYSYETKSKSTYEADSPSVHLSTSEEITPPPKSVSNSASSALTSKETKIKQGQTHRRCQPCPRDMLKNWRNVGIKWICGSYQRARRTFKSECMMRYRNCQDGTMFVKIADHRCKNNAFHGRHWFYIYRT
ncbi:uncharacterized protein LOC128678079 [Plodia interpunctella]|uniref:uncharacterized protein LOC128678079 n=1 Tax=Plodia interpunctella TaxID=58824 RepID=UPI0023688750|nr:uncharacterized protein LOC128678079 [Plodia interpunctella]